MGNKTVLLIALEMPPARSAGVQRPYRFAEYLMELGWDPYILTASEDVYQRFDHELDISPALRQRIFRAKATDVSKKFAIAGRSPDFLAVPDRYWPWYFTATRLAATLIAEKGIQLLWSTYPVLTAHLIGCTLSKRFQLPWIADFRDPLQCHYNPAYQHFNAVQRFFEKRILQQASRVVTTCAAAARLYRQQYPTLPAEKFAVIENGYVPTELPPASVPAKFTLLYSGALYGNGRDIGPLFEAIRTLKQQQRIHADNFVLKFRGSAKREKYLAQLEQHEIAELVEFLPAVPFHQAQAEMLGVSANLLIQDEIFNFQVPGKIYDYVQAGKPVFAICPPDSATADVCRQIPACQQVWQTAEIISGLSALLKQPAQAAATDIAKFSRRSRTVELADLLQQLSAQSD